MQKLLYLLVVCCSAIEHGPIARTPLGALKGSFMTSRLGKRIYSFRGIPYAKAPIGELRFQPPQPVEPWDGVLDATKDGNSCPPSETGADLPTSENCLYCNVYTARLPKNGTCTKKPVIVFLHPGAWYSFTSNSRVFGPQYLLDKGVVLVTLNYRLGVLGFLSTNTSVLPGNYGMKDQVEALRWVKLNIAGFCGDPNNVTISGCSAGSASVMLHMVSPMSRGLFHGAISSSGSALSLWSVRKNPLTYAQRFAKLFNCSSDTSQQIKDCLMTKDAQRMADSIFQLNEWGGAPDVIFGPVIETETKGERFLVEDPIDSFLSGNFAQVPFMVGVTKDELAWRSLRVLNNETLATQINTNTSAVLPIVFDYERDTARSYEITDTLRNLYFQDRPIDNSTVDELAKLFRDGVVGYGADLAAKVVSKSSKAKVWYYKFTYPGRYSWAYRRNTTIPYGVVHQDDLIYLFCIEVRFPCFNSSDPEGNIVETMTTLWTNFAKKGNSTPTKLQNVNWDPFTTENSKYLVIDSKLQMRTRLNQDTLPVWEKLFYPQLPFI